jgi:hypothetical protein
MHVGREDVDGVRALYFEEGAIQGPLRACLMFGVGRVDETIVTSGITHVLEHLTLRSVGRTPYQWNGSVGLVSTRFQVMGEPAQIAEFIGGVAHRLHDLTTDRLADELKILQVEADKQSRNQFALDLCTRFGAAGPGIIDWRELGLHRLEATEIQQWAHDWCTAQNAVLWLSGPPPRDLCLTALPQGEPPARKREDLLTAGRTFVGVKTNSTSMSVLSGDEQWGVIPAFSVCRQRAFDTLRLQDAVCYEVGHLHERIGSGLSIDFLLADGAPDAQRQIFDGLVKIVEDVAANGPTSDELDLYKQMGRQTRDHPDRQLSYLSSQCERILLGWEEYTMEQLDEHTESMTAEELSEDLTAVTSTLLATGSEDIGETPGWKQHSDWSSDLVTGRAFSPIQDREQGQLILGEDGISWSLDAERRRTVRWDDAVACLTYDNGVRAVLALDGQCVHVVPWNWQGATDLTELVDSHVGVDRHLRLGEGELQYLRDSEDAESVADVRWLASLPGAFCRQQRVDLVIDTDGLLVLFGAVPKSELEQRLKVLRSLDRESLLAANPANRWFPEGEIEEVKLARRPLARLNTLKSTLTIRTTAGEVLKIHLVSDRQVELAKESFPEALGPRFRT